MKNERIRKFFEKDTEHVLYWLSIVTIIITGIIYVTQIWFVNYVNQPGLMDCQMKRMFGIPCPGCGGTRAIVNLFRGNLLASLYYNAFATYGCIIYGAFFITQTLQRITKGRIHGMKFKRIFLWIGIAILAIQYVLKLTIPGYII